MATHVIFRNPFLPWREPIIRQAARTAKALMASSVSFAGAAVRRKSEREAGEGDREPHFAPPETGAALRSSTLSWSWIICRSLLSSGLTRRGFWVIACAD